MTGSVQLEGAVPKKRRANPKYHRLVLRPLLDATIAGLVFTLASSAVMCTHAKAGIVSASLHSAVPSPSSTKLGPIKAVAQPAPLPIVQIATASSPADAVYGRTSATAAWTLLGVAFSLMAALNLAMLRHLKRAYAPSARRFPLGK
jgi:hypothetical protein